ncbi:MAG: hypothetical protein AMJ78_01960 [Omnitrophica WOR_2 bacterium SM23_29]|nr:MAG: hypothetical protein AMJ78_01960 [Omnitrophica WOR_2 bacterium SM23_29]
MRFLEEILEHKRRQVEKAEERLPKDEIEKIVAVTKRKDFKGAISKAKDINLIAELKKASPSHGVLRHEYDPKEIAKIYAENGAAAISVLTEEKYFQGNLIHLNIAREAGGLPVLRKDFIISEYQVYESALANADAILLIARILEKGVLRGLYNLAKELEMDVLVEVHDQRDLDKALGTNAEIIGINNRDFATFEVDLNTTLELTPKIPQDKIIVSESGIKDFEDVKRIKERGVKAVLVGEAFMQSDDIAAEIKRIMGW